MFLMIRRQEHVFLMMMMVMLMLMTRRQEQALQEAFRRADNSSEGKLTVDDYLKVTKITI